MRWLKTVEAQAMCRPRTAPIDAETMADAGAIVDDIRNRGEVGLREQSVRLGDISPGDDIVVERPALDAALRSIPAEDRRLLERTAARIEDFARAQRRCLTDLEMAIPGGAAGHRFRPVMRAGCYAPGGRFPLPSSVLMTAVTARAAGVDTVWVASPRPTLTTMAAAAIAGADALLRVGGAQAIAAMAYGAGPVPRCDAVVGPGNRWVTAAKKIVSGAVKIDMLAGPSELLIIADASAEARTIAADLLAQAEHDEDAVPILVCLDPRLPEAVDLELSAQLTSLPTAGIAKAALRNGFCVLARDTLEAVRISDGLAPEHLQLMVTDPETMARECNNYGGLFIGARSAEVFGDYGAGPNHTLPTGGTARHCGGLSVLDFLAARTWMRIDETHSALVEDAAAMARLEGLEGHARAALARAD